VHRRLSICRGRVGRSCGTRLNSWANQSNPLLRAHKRLCQNSRTHDPQTTCDRRRTGMAWSEVDLQPKLLA
jgi:hypothetical protein